MEEKFKILTVKEKFIYEEENALVHEEEWTAPEIRKNEPTETPVDIHSFGVLLEKLFCLPKEEISDNPLHQLSSSCLKKQPTERATIYEVLM